MSDREIPVTREEDEAFDGKAPEVDPVRESAGTGLDLEQYAELGLAMAQSELAAAAEASKSNIRPDLMDGDADLTVKQLAVTMAACGFEVRFQRVPIPPAASDPTGSAARGLKVSPGDVPSQERIDARVEISRLILDARALWDPGVQKKAQDCPDTQVIVALADRLAAFTGSAARDPDFGRCQECGEFSRPCMCSRLAQHAEWRMGINARAAASKATGSAGAPGVERCSCGHTRDEHMALGFGACQYYNNLSCRCQRFVPAVPPAPPVAAPPQSCETPSCQKCGPLSSLPHRSLAVLAMHRAFLETPKGVPSCTWSPYPLHASVSHSWLCDAVVDAAVELVKEAIRVQCDQNAELNAALTRASGAEVAAPVVCGGMGSGGIGAPIECPSCNGLGRKPGHPLTLCMTCSGDGEVAAPPQAPPGWCGGDQPPGEGYALTLKGKWYCNERCRDVGRHVLEPVETLAPVAPNHPDWIPWPGGIPTGSFATPPAGEPIDQSHPAVQAALKLALGEVAEHAARMAEAKPDEPKGEEANISITKTVRPTIFDSRLPSGMVLDPTPALPDG